MHWSEDEDLTLLDLAERGWTAREIAGELPGRTRNAVIGRCHRQGVLLEHKATNRSRAGYITVRMRAKINSMYRSAVRCHRANGGCRNPAAKMIVWSVGGECGYAGCANNKIPYAKHGLCHLHNAERLNADMKRLGEREIPVGW